VKLTAIGRRGIESPRSIVDRPQSDLHDEIPDDAPYQRGRQDPGMIATCDLPRLIHTFDSRDEVSRAVEPRFEANERDGGR
jgi:hypothetical protein